MIYYEIEHHNISSSSFLKSIDILVNKPHVANKRLWGSKLRFRYNCKPVLGNWQIPEECDKLHESLSSNNLETYSFHILKKFNLEKCEKNLNNIEVMLVELFPKNYKDSQAFQLICVEKHKPLAKFYNVSPDKLNQCTIPEFPYVLQLQDKKIVLSASCDFTSSSYLWLKNSLVPQFVKWSAATEINVVKQSFCTDSLGLVSHEDYYKKYNELKLKYGKDMVKIWPECTDPSKFVYEDVAIATYLLLIWENQENQTRKQTFVDLGCGNGLLVYILTQEGHIGVGIDVRKRHIWNMYPSDIKLEEKTITPSDDCLFPNIDWIIGNHSDELTLWIPVIAAKSSYKCNLFLLPCCSYNFDGSKYQRKNSFRSQYMDYLEHIKQLCNNIGFHTETDRLKIPSTKRICFVSRGRTYPEEQHTKYLDKIKQIVENDSKSFNESKANNEWISDFKARESLEKVRNCTRIDKNIIESIVDIICTYLLDGSSAKNSNWNTGKIVGISELVPLIPPDQLKFLKSECGGLQTLMKNHHHIFLVQNGKIQLRYPKTLEEINNDNKTANKKKIKVYKVRQKECWFYKNHPQGCPLTDTSCSFLHEKR